jgi:hypothetical protein
MPWTRARRQTHVTQNELQEIKALQQRIEQIRRVIQPLVEALNDQAEALRFALRVSEPAVPKQLPGPVPERPLEKALRVPDPAVCLAAVQSLEGMANARRRLLLLPANILSLPEKKEGAEPEDKLLPALSKESLHELAILLGQKDGDVQIRLAALYVFEALGKDAKDFGPHIISALDDKNPFIRWGAVRALSEMGPDKADKIVPGLAKCLTDKNADVRRSAASALQRYGPKAKAAVPALCAATQHADPATRLSAVQVLAAIVRNWW